MTETHRRTLARMITYRITAWLLTIATTWWLTRGSLRQATSYATVLHLILSVDYYIHERIWLKVRWGQIDAPPSSSWSRPGAVSSRREGGRSLFDPAP